MSEDLHSLLNQGADLLSLGNPEEAERCFCRILEENPDHQLALYNSAIALSALDRFKAAEQRLNRYIAMRDDDAEAWNQLGFIHFRSGNYGEAGKSYARAESLAPDDPTLQNNIGALHFVRGRYEQALERFTLALEADPSHQDALCNIADTLELLGRNKEAQGYRRRLSEG